MKNPPIAAEESADAADLPSKSQLKREALKATELAKALLQLPHGKRSRLGLSSEIIDALVLADSIRSNSAKKRQLQYIGKLLRTNSDYDSYWQKYENPQLVESATDDSRRQPELLVDQQMRDRLLEDLAAAMDDLREQYPNANTQLIRQLVNRIHKSGVDPNEPKNKLILALSTALQEGR